MLKNHVYDSEIFPISDKRGIGFKFPYGSGEAEVKADKSRENPEFRRCIFSIHSYIGYGGGIHYYGSLKIYTYNEYVDSEGYVSSVGGFLGKGINLPEESKTLRIDILHPLEEWELKKYPHRFDTYKIGDLSNAFYTEEELIDTFKTILPYLLKGKWEVNCEYWKLDDETILIDNDN